MSEKLPTVKQLKIEAKSIEGFAHMTRLEILAKRYGFKNWNTLRAVSIKRNKYNNGENIKMNTIREALKQNMLKHSNHDFLREIGTRLIDTGVFDKCQIMNGPVTLVNDVALQASTRRFATNLNFEYLQNAQSLGMEDSVYNEFVRSLKEELEQIVTERTHVWVPLMSPGVSVYPMTMEPTMTFMIRYAEEPETLKPTKHPFLGIQNSANSSFCHMVRVNSKTGIQIIRVEPSSTVVNIEQAEDTFFSKASTLSIPENNFRDDIKIAQDKIESLCGRGKGNVILMSRNIFEELKLTLDKTSSEKYLGGWKLEGQYNYCDIFTKEAFKHGVAVCYKGSETDCGAVILNDTKLCIDVSGNFKTEDYGVIVKFS